MRKGWPRPRPGRPFGPWLLLAEALLLVSLVAGVVGALSLPEPVRREAAGRLTLPAGGLAPGQEVLAAALRRNLLESALPAWLLGLSLAGFPLVWAIVLWRGFQVGFAAAFLWGWAGSGRRAALLTLLPHNLVALPALALLAAALARLSARIFVSLWRGRPPPPGPLLADGLAALGATLLLVGASYVEAYLTPRLLTWTLELLG